MNKQQGQRLQEVIFPNELLTKLYFIIERKVYSNSNPIHIGERDD